MIDFLNETPLEYPDKKRVVTAPYTGNLPGIRETWNECAKITLNDMALATGLDFSETVSMRYPDERERERRRVAALLALGVLFERQRRAAETDGGAADASALTEHPAAGLSDDTCKAGADADAGERWTVTDANGRIICTGTDGNAADLLMKALDEYDNLTYTLHYSGETAEDNIMF